MKFKFTTLEGKSIQFEASTFAYAKSLVEVLDSEKAIEDSAKTWLQGKNVKKIDASGNEVAL